MAVSKKVQERLGPGFIDVIALSKRQQGICRRVAYSSFGLGFLFGLMLGWAITQAVMDVRSPQEDTRIDRQVKQWIHP